MALGAITQVQTDPHAAGVPAAVGDLKVTVTNIVGEASYTTGGVAITPQQLGLSIVLFAQAELYASTGTNATSAALSVTITNNGSTINLKCFSNAGVEITGAVNVSGITWQIIAFGY